MESTVDIPREKVSTTSINTQYYWLNQFQPGTQLLQGRSYRRAKRLMDLLVLSVGLPFVFPLILFCIILIWLETPGASIFYKQERTGKGGKRFRMYKFRTMVENADELKKELVHLNELQWPDFKVANDPRITRVGRFMRKTSLDEVPQLFNVLTGEMSLVGPRPTSFKAETYRLWQTERLDVLPGITGLWQIYGRSSTEFDERLRMDIAYIEKRCIWMDIQILLRTILAVFEQRGAR